MLLIKIFTIYFSFSIFSLGIFAKTVVISDIDDTIKMSHSMGTVSNAYYFFKARPFPVMKNILVDLKNLSPDSDYFYVSAAPRLLFKGNAWIKEHGFPKGPVYLRKINSPDIYTYKYITISTIIKNYIDENENISFIFLGDNSEHDPIIYKNIIEKYNLNASIFIRDVATTGTSLSSELNQIKIPGVNFFFSELDLLSFDQFSFITEETTNQIKRALQEKKLIPRYIRETLTKRLIKKRKCVANNLFRAIRCRKKSKEDAAKIIHGHYQ